MQHAHGDTYKRRSNHRATLRTPAPSPPPSTALGRTCRSALSYLGLYLSLTSPYLSPTQHRPWTHLSFDTSDEQQLGEVVHGHDGVRVRVAQRLAADVQRLLNRQGEGARWGRESEEGEGEGEVRGRDW